jgi:hypothetical protein
LKAWTKKNNKIMNMKKEWRESAEREFRKSPIFQTTQNMT